MVVCDHNLLIRDFHIGEAGSLHDFRVFRRSPLFRKLVLNENNEMLLPDEHILGDTAYAVMDCVGVPFLTTYIYFICIYNNDLICCCR